MKNKLTIALVTWYGVNSSGSNYGTSLQSFALLRKLKDLGYNAKILPERQKTDLETLRVCPEYFLRLIRSCNFFDLLKHAFRKWVMPASGRAHCTARGQQLFSDQLTLWEKRNYDVSVFSSRKERLTYLKSVACFIAGSDQIWNTYFLYNPFYFLGFAKGKKCISYASSIGTSSVCPKFRTKVLRHLQYFSHISTREESARVELAKLTGRSDIVRVLDPTFLLTNLEWRNIAAEVPLRYEIPAKYALCYVISKNINEGQIKRVAAAYNVGTIIVAMSAENPSFDIEGSLQYGRATPSEFVSLVQNATVVCTDSFHGMAFSINLSVPFVAFKRFDDNDIGSQNSRIYDLLTCFKLTDRWYDDVGMQWRHDIDFTQVRKLVERKRNESLSYLVNAIEN